MCGELYSGRYQTRQEAIDDGLSRYEDEGHFYVGENVPPRQPEEFWSCETWLDHVSEQDDYCNEWADSWDRSNREQRSELELAVKDVLAAWLDRHKLRPKFWNVEKAQKYEIRDEQAVPVP